MATCSHISRRSKTTALLRRPKHRTSTPSTPCIRPPPCRTEDDLIYGYFITNLLKPFKGTTKGMENPPPEIVSCHLVHHQEETPAIALEAMKVEDLETSRHPLQQSDRGSSEGSFTMELNSIKEALDKLVKRCADISRRAKGIAKRRHQVKLDDAEESILNRRIEEMRPTKEYLNELGCPVVLW